MQLDNLLTVLLIIGLTSTVFYGMFRISRYAFIINFLMLGVLVFNLNEQTQLILIALYLVCPLTLINIVCLFLLVWRKANIRMKVSIKR